MPLTRPELKKLGLEADQINAIMDLHGESTESLKEAHKVAIETAQTTISTLQGEKATLEKAAKEAPTGDDEKLKADLATALAEVETLKSAQTLANDKAQLTAFFTGKGANSDPDVIDMLIGKVDTAKLTRAKDGKFEGLDEALKPLVEAKKQWFQPTQTQGANFPTPPAGSNARNYEAELTAAREKGNTALAMRIKQEAFENDKTVLI